jgi:hypothetical protein
MKNKHIKYECPVCLSNLGHIRTENEIGGHIINKDGTIVDAGGKCNGDDEVFCTNNKQHDIPEELIQKVLDLIY